MSTWDPEERGARHPEAERVVTEDQVEASRQRWRDRREDEFVEAIATFAKGHSMGEASTKSLEDTVIGHFRRMMAMRELALDGGIDSETSALDLEEERLQLREDLVALLGADQTYRFLDGLPPVARRTIWKAKTSQDEDF